MAVIAAGRGTVHALDARFHGSETLAIASSSVVGVWSAGRRCLRTRTLTVVTGANGAGKSSLYRALCVLADGSGDRVPSRGRSRGARGESLASHVELFDEPSL